MEPTYKTPDIITSMWNRPPNCPAPVFPLIYFEWLKGVECRGFLRLEHLIGDIDFVGYPLENDDILIDSLGRVFDLKFDEFVFPNSVIAVWSENELRQYIIPALEYSNNAEFEKDIMNEKNVADIINKMAIFYTW